MNYIVATVNYLYLCIANETYHAMRNNLCKYAHLDKYRDRKKVIILKNNIIIKTCDSRSEAAKYINDSVGNISTAIKNNRKCKSYKVENL